jgi:hypothetical protein
MARYTLEPRKLQSPGTSLSVTWAGVQRLKEARGTWQTPEARFLGRPRGRRGWSRGRRPGRVVCAYPVDLRRLPSSGPRGLACPEELAFPGWRDGRNGRDLPSILNYGMYFWSIKSPRSQRDGSEHIRRLRKPARSGGSLGPRQGTPGRSGTTLPGLEPHPELLEAERRHLEEQPPVAESIDLGVAVGARAVPDR